MSETDTIARLTSLVGVVRRAFVVRKALRTMLACLIVLGVLSVATSVLVPHLPRWPWLVPVGLSALVALAYVRRLVPDETSLVWYVDRKLGAQELLLTLHDAARRGERDEALFVAASGRLEKATAKDVRPRLFGRELFAMPFVGVLAVLVFIWPIPPAQPRAESRNVQLSNVSELDAVERLPELRTPQRAALERAAREARALRRSLEAGMSQREAIERVDRVREQVAAARSEDSPRSRRAREAAIEALSGEREMAEALGARDLEGLSRAVERAAARREADDRARARQALTRAAEAARNEGDDALSESLLSRERLMRAREEQSALARELAEAMPELSSARMRRALETLEREGDAGALDREMVDAMRTAWQRLTPEERQRLAEAMSRAQAARNETRGERQAQGSPQAGGESRQGEQPSADELERRLREALANLDSLERRVGGQGIPMPGRGTPQPGGQTGGSQAGNQGGRQGGSQSGNGQAPGQGGPSRGGGPGGTPTGSTRALEGDPLLARVRPLERAGAPAETFVDWVEPSAPGAPGTLPVPSGAGAAGDPNPVTRARVPEEYREHVRTYFGGGN